MMRNKKVEKHPELRLPILFSGAFFISMVIMFILSSCGSSRMVETSLYFGQSKPDGTSVSAQEWNSFQQEYIRKVFVKGSSVISVSGNWYDTAAQKLITEPTYVAMYYYKPSPLLSRQIDSLRYWYKSKFDQQSVLRVDRKVKAAF